MRAKRLGRVAVVAAVVAGVLAPVAAHADYSMQANVSLPSRRTRTSAVWDGTNAYVFGGMLNSGTTTNQIVRYNPAANTVTTMSAVLPSARYGTSAIYDGTYAYVFGGNLVSGGSTPTNEIVRYDPATDTASVVATLPSARYDTSAIWDGTHAYIFGGTTSNLTRLDKIVRFNPASNNVTTMSISLPSARTGTSAAFDGASAYVFGGDTSAGASAEILRYNTTTGVVTTRSSTLPTGRSHTASVWDGHNFFTLSGYAGSTSYSDIVKFNVVSGAVTTMSSGTWWAAGEHLSAVWTGTSVYYFGGSTTSDIVRYELTPAPPQSPAATAAPGAGQITVTWQPPPANTHSGPITNYQIARGAGASGAVQFLADVGTALTYTDSGLGDGTTWHYVIWAETSAGSSGSSNVVSATTLPPSGPNPPSAPQSPAAVTGPGAGEISVSWQAPASNGGSAVTGYRVYVATTASGPFSQLADVGSGTFAYTHSGLGNGVARYYRVAAGNVAGYGAPSTTVGATTYSTPSAPTNLTASIGPGIGEVSLAWQPPVSGAVTGYRVYRRIDGGAWVFVADAGAQLAYVDDDRALGHTYVYGVTAVSPVGEGPRSNDARARGTGVPNAAAADNGDGTFTVYADQDGDGAVDPDEPYLVSPAPPGDGDGDRVPDLLEPTLCANENTALLSDGSCAGGDYVPPTAADAVSDLLWLLTGQRP